MSGDGPVVAFLGPSLEASGARGVLAPSDVLLPPAQAGDVLRSLRLRPRAIALIDGRFDDVPSPWHKELLYARELGIHVFGGASMGALRAVECRRHGVEPVGRIADEYRAGRRDDDAVAIRHLPGAAGWVPVSDALVDIEQACREAAVDGRLDEEEVARMRRVAEETSYVDRRIPDGLRIHDGPTRVKRSDAIATLERAVGSGPRSAPGGRVPRTTWLLRLARSVLAGPLPPVPGLPGSELRFHELLRRAGDARTLVEDALLFPFVDGSEPLDGAVPRPSLIRFHRSRIPEDAPDHAWLTDLATMVAVRQSAILDAIGPCHLDRAVVDILGVDPETPGVLEDRIARLARSEGVPPCLDRLLDTDPGCLLDRLPCGSGSD